MGQIGEKRRIIRVPIRREQPATTPVPEPVKEPEPVKVPA